MRKIYKERLRVAIVYCLVLLIMTKLLGERPFQGDVEDYWAYGEKLWETGRFSLNIDGYRGYVFPLCLGICNQMGGGIRMDDN